MTGTRHVKFANLLTHQMYTITWHAMLYVGVTVGNCFAEFILLFPVQAFVGNIANSV